jgi:hypothetical protein
MSIDIKYTGTQIRWPELAITGKQSVWFPGQEEERSDSEAALLLATGLFERSASSQSPVSGGGLTSRIGGAAVGKNGTGAVLSGAISTAWTGAQAWRIPHDIAAFRVGFENLYTAGQLPDVAGVRYAVVGASGNTGAQALDAMATYPSGSLVDITFDGSLAFTPKRCPGANRPSPITWSDYMSVSGADEGKTLAARMFVPLGGSWNYTYHSLLFGTYSQYLSQVTNPVGGWQSNTDLFTGNPAWSLLSSNATANLVIPYIEWIAKSSAKKVLCVAHFSDSLGTGFTTDGSTAPSVTPVARACQSLSTADIRLVPMVGAFGGRTTEQNFRRFVQYMQDAKTPPNIVVWQVTSQNSATSTSNVQATEGYIRAVQQICTQAGAVLVLQTGAPINGNSINADNARKAINTLVRAMGLPVIDTAATWGNGASPEAYAAAYGTAAHPALIGYDDDMPQWLAAIRLAVTQFGLTV